MERGGNEQCQVLQKVAGDTIHRTCGSSWPWEEETFLQCDSMKGEDRWEELCAGRYRSSGGRVGVRL